MDKSQDDNYYVNISEVIDDKIKTFEFFWIRNEIYQWFVD